MVIQIDVSKDKPLYEQVKNEVIRAILCGELVEGEMLPSARAMASSLSINMHTVTKAYGMLKQDGFVTVLRSKGVIVNHKDNYIATSTYNQSLNEALESYIIEAKCRGLKEADIIEIVQGIYNRY